MPIGTIEFLNSPVFFLLSCNWRIIANPIEIYGGILYTRYYTNRALRDIFSLIRGSNTDSLNKLNKNNYVHWILLKVKFDKIFSLGNDKK